MQTTSSKYPYHSSTATVPHSTLLLIAFSTNDIGVHSRNKVHWVGSLYLMHESPRAGWARFEHWVHFSLIDSRLSPSLFSVSKSIHAHGSPHIETPGVAIVLRGNRVYNL